MSLGNLYILFVLSGVGKFFLINVLFVDLFCNEVCLLIFYIICNFCLVEEDGVYYYFIIYVEFEVLIEKDYFFEWVEVFGNYYGIFLLMIEKLFE